MTRQRDTLTATINDIKITLEEVSKIVKGVLRTLRQTNQEIAKLKEATTTEEEKNG
jgi:hypothetical protein